MSYSQSKGLMKTLLFSVLCLLASASFCPAAFATDGKKVEIFVTSWCPYCTKLEKFLKEKRIDFSRHDVETDARAKAKHQSLGGGGIPVVLIDAKTVIRGFDKSALCAELKSAC